MLPSRRISLALFASALAVFAAALVQADGSSGTWTGNIDTRANYYWERSTRVVSPTVHMDLEAPNGLRLSGDYVLDMITSASVGSGLVSDTRFTEKRNEGLLGVGYEWNLGGPRLLTMAHGRISHEPDYDSYSGGLRTQLSLNDRSTVFALDLNGMHDNVGRILRGATRVINGRNLSNRGEIGTLNSYFLTAGWTQILTPALYFEVGYDIGVLDGFQSNPYRMVTIGGVPMLEKHPNERTRHSLYGRLAYYFHPTRTAIHLLYRGYVDNWDIAAITPEIRLYQEITSLLTVRARYRYYAQSNAYFQKSATTYSSADPYFTADPKMTAFHSNLLGGEVLLKLDFLSDTALHFADRALLDFSFDYIWNTNRYGNGVIAQMGLRIPF